MKNFIFKAAITLFATAFIAQHTATAQSNSFNRSQNTLISFQTGNNIAPNAKVIIRNSAGQIVRSKNIYAACCNVETSLFSAGSYSYTIVNGKQTTGGTFSVR